MIRATGLGKQFKVYHKQAGLAHSIRALFKREYEYKQAVQNFSLTVEKGEILGLLGPNGAGKTTLIKMCTGIVVPSSGSLTVLDHVPHQRSFGFRKHVALVMGQKSQLWWDLPAMDSLKLLQRYYDIDDAAFEARVADLAGRLQVESLLALHVRKLSLGERMKMELLACLLHQPEVIFLDEPTIGLDVIAQQNIRQFLKEYHQENQCTIILTSHYMADVEALCDRIVLILEGRKRFDGSRHDFEGLLGKEKFVRFSFSQAVDTTHEVWKDFYPIWNEEGTHVDLRIPDSVLRQTSVDILGAFPVQDFYTEKLPIERVMSSLLQNPELLEENGS